MSEPKTPSQQRAQFVPVGDYASRRLAEDAARTMTRTHPTQIWTAVPVERGRFAIQRVS